MDGMAIHEKAHDGGGLIVQMVVEAVDRGIEADGSSLQVSVLAAFGQAVLQVAQFDDQAFDDRFQAALVGGLVVGLAGSSDGGGVHSKNPLRFGVTAVISRLDLLQLDLNSQQKERCTISSAQQRRLPLDETLERASRKVYL